MSEKFLQGKVALVTGGASGMGRAMALSLADAGADVAIGSLLSNRSETKVSGELVNMPGQEELDRTASELERLGVKVFASALEVTDDESVRTWVEKSREVLGGVHILANAAGITAEQTVVGHPDPLWMKVVDVNLNGTYRAIKYCLPLMIEQKWGRIINIASTAASVGAPTSAAYCASKAAVVGLTRCVALEGAEFGVTCNSISPGWVETKFGTEWMTHIAETAEGTTGSDYIAATKAGNPQKRMIQPREIGTLAAYLCREEAQGMTMQDLTVSAGSLW